ncbi:MAG: hypothetical protein DDG59_08380 [Anaerolineae bacterium]|nr:MAG: hypothetical protein DDG59_08380 [Anaerolineae bacterium]
MKIKPTLSTIILLMVSILSFSLTEGTNLTAAMAYSGYPYFYITSVTPDTSVTIRAYNFPANDTFKVMMNKIGTKGINGIVVDTISSGAGGSFTATFSIPNALKGQKQIAIRLQSTSGSGYYAYNWFYNSSTKYGTGGPYPVTYQGYPTIAVKQVVKNKYIILQMTNLPKNDQFKVLMNRYGTKGIKGVQVATFSTGSGGSQTIKVKIPKSFKDVSLIAVRIQSTSGSGYFAYNWFYNR